MIVVYLGRIKISMNSLGFIYVHNFFQYNTVYTNNIDCSLIPRHREGPAGDEANVD